MPVTENNSQNYTKALKRIEKAKQNKQSKLDLSELNLNDSQFSSLLKIIIEELPNLEGLDLSDNNLSSLPEPLYNLVHIQKLYLSDNHISSLHESLGNLINLEELYLSDNHISSLPESLGYLQELFKLDLSDNNLSTVPESIVNLSSNLEDFYLKNPLQKAIKKIGYNFGFS